MVGVERRTRAAENFQKCYVEDKIIISANTEKMRENLSLEGVSWPCLLRKLN
jgi:hypothetical protein